jgi:hypothetical protein
MKRLLLVGAAVIAACGFAVPAHADDDVAAQAEPTTPPTIDPTLFNYTASLTNDLLNSIPGLGGPDTRHLCFIFDKLDKSYCVYIPLP